MQKYSPSHFKKHFDYPLAVMVFALAAFGVVSVSVATFSTDSQSEDSMLNYILASHYGLRQAIFFLVSFVVVGVVTYALPYEFLRRNSLTFYIFACGLLLVALVASKAGGVKAWIDIIWGYTLQPAEFVKLACIISLAKYLSTHPDPMSTFRDWAFVIIMMAIPWGLTLLQGETGSVIVMVFVFAVMMYFGGLRLRTMIIVATLVLILLGVGYAVIMSGAIKDYRVTRILSFLDPSLVDEGASYQVDNSKIAIGSGGLSGKGAFVEGSMSQLDYVPEDWTDFIFSTIGEAWGFIGCASLTVVYLLVLLRMLHLARYVPDRFGELIIIGVMGMLLIHVFENIGMTTGLMPVTGIPLPLVSYGGSNLITNMAGIGLVLNVVNNADASAVMMTSSGGRYGGRWRGRKT